jgi:3-hydroxybutyryl-CoA dehydrogenase/3-hydroxyacyl-CoA dehydrogenase
VEGRALEQIEHVRVGVLGAGVMGAGIAQVMAIAGHDVACHDRSPEAVVAARDHVDTGRFGVRGAVARGLLSAPEADAALARIDFTDDVESLHGCAIVIEAIPERLDLKIAAFRELDRRCGPDTVLASNSSGFPIAALAAATDRPDRVVGWHWASPAPVMRFAEVVRAPGTSDATVELVVELARRAGKHPVVVRDNPMAWGYVANRVYGAMIREAGRVADEGVATREEIDQLMIDCFRWPAGPFGMTRGASSGWT